jgi:hypothetical protein
MNADLQKKLDYTLSAGEAMMLLHEKKKKQLEWVKESRDRWRRLYHFLLNGGKYKDNYITALEKFREKNEELKRVLAASDSNEK